MYDELTEQDIKKMEEEIEYRRRREPREISARILNIMRQKRTRTRTRAESAIWRR